MKPVKALALDLGIRQASLYHRAERLGIKFYKSSRKRGVNGTPIALASEAQEKQLREYGRRA